MITIKQLQHKYLRRIPGKFKVEIEKYINEPKIQDFLKKAIKYRLTDAERNYIWQVGQHKSSQYPHLYWLLFIYMHPYTALGAIATKIQKLGEPIFPDSWTKHNPEDKVMVAEKKKFIIVDNRGRRIGSTYFNSNLLGRVSDSIQTSGSWVVFGTREEAAEYIAEKITELNDVRIGNVSRNEWIPEQEINFRKILALLRNSRIIQTNPLRNPGRSPALGLWAIVGGLALVGYGIYDNYKK